MAYLFSALIFLLGSNVWAESPDAVRDYDRAQKLLDAGQENQALVSFTDFLRRYATEERAGDARYSLGEIYFRRRDFTLALEEYKKLYHSVPGAHRIADATVRVGECLDHLGKTNEARIEWEAVTRKFPRSAAASRAKILLAGQKVADHS